MISKRQIQRLFTTEKLFLKFFVVIVCGLNLSCSSFKNVEENKQRLLLTKDNITLLDGTYLNNTNVKVYPISYFWGKNYKSREYDSVYELVYEQKLPYFVGIKVLNEEQLYITIFVDNRILKSYVLKGKLKNGYFEQRRKFFVIPMIFFNSYHSSKFRIGILNNRNIITDYDKKSYIHYMLMTKDNSESLINIEHIKISNDTIK